MDECLEVNTDNNVTVPVKIFEWKSFLRQFLVCSAVWTIQFMCGLSIGSPTVFVPQIRKEANSTEAINIETASWMSSIYSFSGLFFVLVLSILMKHFGRKPSVIFCAINSFIAFLLLFCSRSNTTIIISLAISGVLSAAQTVVSIVVLTEYISPRYRGFFLTGKCAIFYWGIWVSNTIGTFFHWKKIALVGLILSLYPLVTVLFWTESPYWFASKGRFEECAESHRWLKGTDVGSQKELQALIKSQKEYRKSRKREKVPAFEQINGWYKVITSEEFYKPTLISLCLGFINIFCGKMMTAIYAIDIIKKVTDSESAAYSGMLILDGITILSMYVGCVMSKFIKRRTMLFTTSVLGVVLMLSISLYLYLIKLCVIIENTYVSIGLFLIFSVVTSCGPIILTPCIYGELIPLRSRHLITCLLAIFIKIFAGTTLKVTPLAFKLFGLYGVYLGFGIISTVAILIAYIYLPETKDMTLQQISECMLSSSKRNKIIGAKNDSDELVNLRSLK